MNNVTMEDAFTIMESNYIGPEQLKTVRCLRVNYEMLPDIPYTTEELFSKRNDYLLVLGVNTMSDGRAVTIRNMIDVFGKNPNDKEPCFYNQDWYDQEEFIDLSMEEKWFLIRKKVFEDSRAVQPQELMRKYEFPLAIDCVYAFFVAWLTLDIKLWYQDFVWCKDVDHNGDRIYVGKYNDIDGMNRNGFSIHRHLALRDCYASI